MGPLIAMMRRLQTSTHPTTRTIVKAMGLFGGVRALAIICSLVRNKLIAIWIGPAGVGLVILFNSVADLVTNFARLNTDQSALRDVARAGRHDVGRTVTVVRAWSLALGVGGGLLMCALAPALSLWSFGDTGHWWAFCALSLVPLSLTIAGCRQSVMQGLGMLGRLARASTFGAIVGIAATVPLVYWLRENAIIWVVVAYAVATLIGALIYSPRIAAVRLTAGQIWHLGAGFIRLGFLITLATITAKLCNYLFVLFMNNYASTVDLGLYQAGYILIDTYVGVLFMGSWVEYFPRLTAQVHSVRRTSLTVSHQTVTLLWLLMPVVALFVAVDEWVVRLLYDASFVAMLPMVTIGIAGIVLRATSWALAHTMLARGDGKVYVISETLSGIITLVLNVTMYLWWGFAGLGLSFVASYGMYTIICYVIYRRRYGYVYAPGVWLTVALAVTFVAAVVVAKFAVGWWLPALLCVAMAPFSYRRLTRRPA